MKTKTLKDLQAKHAAEIAEAERKEQILKALVGIPGVVLDDVTVCIHDGKRPHASVKLWNDFRTSRKLVDAVRVVRHFKDSIIEGEHWKDGCVSTWPEEINSCIKNKNAVMDGAHAVEIDVKGGRGYGPDVSVQFWTRLAGILCEIECPVSDQWRLVPTVRGKYHEDGSFTGSITWPPAETQTADKFLKFWSEPPSFKGSYYLADVPNFMSWVSNHVTKEELAEQEKALVI